MSIFSTIVSAAILLVSSVTAQTCTPCNDVHFFLARGNNEPYPGRQAALVQAACNGVANCGYEDLTYSALYTDLSCQTTYDGVLAGFTQLTAYADRCPDAKLILTGYSQGAQIVTDILGGGGGVSFNGCIQPNTAALDRTTSPGNRLSAVLAIGNTRHTANQPYNYGSGSALDGLFPKSGTQLSAIAEYADITRDWCVSTDPICAANQTTSNVTTHLNYYNVYAQEAAAWVQSIALFSAESDVTTTIPISVSGIVQDYSTIGTETPSGSVKIAAITTASVQCGSVSTSGTGTTSTSSVTRTASVTDETASRSLGSASTSAPVTQSTAASGASTGTHPAFGFAFGLGTVLCGLVL